MSTRIEAFTNLLKRLLPRGKAWEQIREDAINLFPGMAEEFCRIEERGADLLLEFDPGTSTEMLEDWETLLGLPDECSPLAPTLAERQIQARQKLASMGGIDAQFYIDVAAALGFPVTITDYVTFKAGIARVGDSLTNAFDPDTDVFRVGRERVGTTLVTHGWRPCFEVNGDSTGIFPFRVGANRVGEPLVVFGNDLLKCTILKLKPAETCVYFTFG